MMFFSEDIKTNNMKIYYADESSCKDKIDLIQIFFSRNTVMIKPNKNTLYHFDKFYREGENS